MMEEKATKQPFGVDDYIGFAESLKERCRQLGNVDGIGKLERKIHAELKFLNTVKSRDQEAHPSHLHSSNLCHFASIVHAAEGLPDVRSVLRPFRTPGGGQLSMVVDVVACQGHHWVKVIARKGQALHLIWAGQGQFGERDLVAQAEDYLHASECNTHHFMPPKVHMVFYNQVTFPMAEALTSLGITVWGERVEVHEDVMLKLTSVLSLDDTVDDDDDDDDFDKNIEEGDGRDSNYNNGDINKEKDCYLGLSVTSGAGITRLSSLDANFPIHSSSTDFSSTTNISCRPRSSSNTLDIENPDDDPGLSPCVSTCSSNRSCMQPSCINTNVDALSSEVHSSESSGELRTTVCTPTTTTTTTTSIGTSCSFTDSFHNTCKLTATPSSIPVHPHDALFRDIVHSPPDYSSFPNLPSNNSLRFSTPPSSSSSSSTTTTTTPSSQFSGIPCPRRANLDITSLITLVSNVTHGHCCLVFKEKVLASQALEERQAPCLPALQAYLEGKELYACQTAVDSFHSILDVLGGPREKERAASLLSGVNVVPDQPSPRASGLDTQGKIKYRSKIVFGTGDTLKAVTVTSNTGFVRAARHQGVDFSVFTHPARALTEEKEPSATPL